MTSRTSEYWERRTLQLEEAQHNKAERYMHDLEEQYTLAARRTQQDVLVLYNRLAANNGVSLAEAKRMLTTNELREFRWTVDEYIKYGRENAISGEWMKELENASLRYRISRLEAMKVQMQHHAECLMAQEADGMTRMLSDMYTEGYYRTGHMIQSGLGIGHSFAEVDTRKVDQVLSRPWAPDGRNFSERIWGSHRPQLVNDLHTGLTQMIARGEAPDKLIDMVAARYNVSKAKAGNLVMTEAAYFSSKADQDSFKELGVEEQQFCATLDTHTSQLCRDMDGHVFKTSDIVIGENAPPLHCRCRSVMIPHFEGNVKERIARNEDGSEERIPENISYREWEERYVKGRGEDGTPAPKPAVQTEPTTLTEKVESIRPELEARRSELGAQQRTLSNKNRELQETRDAIQELEVRRTDLQSTQTRYNTWRDLDMDTGIEGMQGEIEHWQQKVDELEARHSRYFDRPERGTPEYDAWRTWKRGVNYDELFDRLVDAKRELTTAQSQLTRMQDMRAFVSSVDIDKLTAQIDEVEDALNTKRVSAAMLTDDIAHLTDDIADTRLAIERDYQRAGKAFIEELDNAQLIGGDEIDRLRKAKDDAGREYMRYRNTSKGLDLWDEYKKAERAFLEATEGMEIHNAEVVRDVISRVRSVGASNADDLLKVHLNNSKSQVVSAVTRAYSHYPTDWVDASAAANKLSVKKVNRGFYSHGTATIAISGNDASHQFRTAVHELGHRFERTVDDLLDIEKTFYDRRTKGERLQWLGTGYGRNERSRFDEFLNPYMGKDYGETAYEIVSMGFELGYTDPLRLLKDKDMAELIYGLLLMK